MINDVTGPLSEAVSEALGRAGLPRLPATEILWDVPREPTHGDYATNVALVLAKAEARADESACTAPVDLYAVADRAVHEWVQRAIARDIDLGFVLEHAQVAGDMSLLGELLDNLLDNALRYTPGGRAVTVRCGIHLGRPYLSVEDTGPGIPEAAHGRVLERFYRIQGTPGDGAGLGLAIVNEVAQRHRATLQIESADGPTTLVRIRPNPELPS